jgi:hypothetical protein
MRPGHLYRHEYAQDIFIDVKSAFAVEPGQIEICCDIYNYWWNSWIESSTFILKSEERVKWELFTPVTK